MSVYKKLMDARIKLQSIELKKSGLNKFAGYQYFELADFLPVIQKIFHEIGLCGIVSYSSDLASLTIVDLEDNSEIIITSPMASASLKGCHEVQNLGAVETYQRRYLWVTALEILEHDALDKTSGKEEKEEKKEPKPKTLPVMPDDAWNKNHRNWQEMVIAGKKTSQNIIDFIQSKGNSLTDERKDLIRSWEVKELDDVPQ